MVSLKPQQEFIVSSLRSAKVTSQVDISVNPRSDVSLVEQISRQIADAIWKGRIPVGTKLPSVRGLAKDLGVSPFSVAASYDLLASWRAIMTRKGLGCFVAKPIAAPKKKVEGAAVDPDIVSDFWLSTDVFTRSRLQASPGCGWLPSSWYSDRTIVGDAIRRLSRLRPEHLASYGHPAGYTRLRHRIVDDLSARSMNVTPDQIVLTHGVTHALDIVLRTLLRPGDKVFVESPGYSNLNALISRHGCSLLPIARTAQGVDLNAIEELAATHRPKALFVTTVLQNPLGTTLKPIDAHRLLGLAERHSFIIIEDDIHRKFGEEADPSLAAMDGFNRVILVDGYSKTITPSLRCGYIACNADLVQGILRTKMLTGLTTSEISERTVFEVISDRNYRRSVEKMRTRLMFSQDAYREFLLGVGLTPLAEPNGGMFLSAGWPVSPEKGRNARLMAQDVLNEEGLALAPCDFFYPDGPQSIWFRFNVAHQNTDRLAYFLTRAPKRYGFRF